MLTLISALQLVIPTGPKAVKLPLEHDLQIGKTVWKPSWRFLDVIQRWLGTKDAGCS